MALYKCKFTCKHNGTPYKAGETKECDKDPGRFFELVKADSGFGSDGNKGTGGETGGNGAGNSGVDTGGNNAAPPVPEAFTKKMKDAYNADPMVEIATAAGIEGVAGSKAERAEIIYRAIKADATCLEKLPEDVREFYAEVQEA